MGITPYLGSGVGLRPSHYSYILENHPTSVDWFEAISENYMDTGGRPLSKLLEVRQNYPIALHGVSLSIGSTDPLSRDYLKNLKSLSEKVEPFIISDHLCWTSVDQRNTHDLLPLPFTQEALDHVISRVHEVQEALGRSILLENVSSYVTYKFSQMEEWEFLSQVSQRSGCGILLDINNIYVSAHNHGFKAEEYINNIPKNAVGQFHLAGHSQRGDFLFDNHGAAVKSDVWQLFELACRRFGPISTLVEWDDDIPDFPVVAAEALKAKEVLDRAA